jgi:hypothetical protein
MAVRVEVSLPSEEEIASLVGGEHDDVLVELERLGRMVQAAKLGVIDHADRSARFLADGHRNSAAWTRAVTNRSRRLPNGWWVIQRPDGTPVRPLDAA